MPARFAVGNISCCTASFSFTRHINARFRVFYLLGIGRILCYMRAGTGALFWGGASAAGAGTREGALRLVPLRRYGEMANGTVKWFSPKKGYGFITMEDGQEVFVHYSAIDGAGFRSLEQGERVEFEVGQGPKGLQASNVNRG